MLSIEFEKPRGKAQLDNLIINAEEFISVKRFKALGNQLSDKKIKHLNKHKGFEYGYNEDLDCVIISKDGTLGDIYNIQGLKVGLPQTPTKTDGKDLKNKEQYFS